MCCMLYVTCYIVVCYSIYIVCYITICIYMYIYASRDLDREERLRVLRAVEAHEDRVLAHGLPLGFAGL